MLYPIAIEEEMYEGEILYGVVVPDLLGCIAVGRSVAEAYACGAEAIMMHLASLLDDDEPIPLPQSIETYQDHEDYQGVIWALVEVDLSKLTLYN